MLFKPKTSHNKNAILKTHYFFVMGKYKPAFNRQNFSDQEKGLRRNPIRSGRIVAPTRTTLTRKELDLRLPIKKKKVGGAKKLNEQFEQIGDTLYLKDKHGNVTSFMNDEGEWEPMAQQQNEPNEDEIDWNEMIEPEPGLRDEPLPRTGRINSPIISKKF